MAALRDPDFSRDVAADFAFGTPVMGDVELDLNARTRAIGRRQPAQTERHVFDDWDGIWPRELERRNTISAQRDASG